MDLDTTQFCYGILSGMLPPFLWLWFWLKEDHLHPEPRSRVAWCFFFGMVAVLIALPLQYVASRFFFDDFHRYIVWAFIEEVLKFGAVYVVIFRNNLMDEPIDSMIYMLTAALGFAALENTFFMLGVIKNGDIVSAVITGNLRFMGAILLHVVCSSVIGFLLALAYYHRMATKVIAIIAGIAIAGTLHATFNLAIINGATFNTLRAFGWVWGGVVLLVILFEEVKAIKPKQPKQVANQINSLT